MAPAGVRAGARGAGGDCKVTALDGGPKKENIRYEPRGKKKEKEKVPVYSKSKLQKGLSSYLLRSDLGAALTATPDRDPNGNFSLLYLIN